MPAEPQDSRPRKGRVKDARGRKVVQLDPVALHLLHRSEPIEREVLARIIAEKGVGLSRLDKIPMIAAPVMIVAIAGVMLGKHLAGEPWPALLRRAMPLFYVLILPFTVWGSLKAKRSGRIAAAILKHHRCPHCGYDLFGLPADPDDGATVCPECGCAWPAPESPSST